MKATVAAASLGMVFPSSKLICRLWERRLSVAKAGDSSRDDRGWKPLPQENRTPNTKHQTLLTGW